MKSHEGRGVYLPQERIRDMTQCGAWANKVLIDYFDACVSEDPDRVFAVSYTATGNQRRQVSFAEMRELSNKIAGELLAMGVGLGDIVSAQLPNRHEALALGLACARIGAVINPLMPVLRERELRHVLTLTEAKVFFVQRYFRGFDHAALAEKLKSEIETLQYVVILEDEDMALENAPQTDLSGLKPDPNELFQLMFTSGTTGESKGAMHTANTILANVVQLEKRFACTANDVIFCPTPLGHQLGFLIGLCLPCVTGAKVVFLDSWHLDLAFDICENEGATICVGATPFLADMAKYPDVRNRDLSAFRLFISGGAPIPSPLVTLAYENLGAMIVSIWGMTEVLAVTTVPLDAPLEKVSGTDGVPTEFTEVRIVDFERNILPVGVEGILETRGATVCVGYIKRPDMFSMRDGWFDTGDLAKMDADGYIRITGRSKDVIIRGGENIPVTEIEGMLFAHPAVEMVSIVAIPDERLGERACVYVLPKKGQKITLADICAFLDQKGVAKVYMPERLELLAAMPMTATGKIQKFELREWAKSLSV